MNEIETMARAAEASWRGRKVMITGGLGFIGSNLARRLERVGADILIVDSLIPSHGGNRFNVFGLEGRLRVCPVDLRDAEALPELVRGQSIIFNLAGQSAHLDSMDDPIADLTINCTAQLHLLEACRRHNPGVKLIYTSTRQIYGRASVLPVDERQPPRPVDINGVNKWAGESYHLLYNRVHDLQTVSLRLTNTYGPRMRIKDARQTFLGVWIRRVLAGEPIEVWGGTQLRDLTYVDDCVDALMAAAETAAVDGGVYNIGGDRVIDLASLARLVIDAHGGGEIVVKPFPVSHERIDIGDYYADDRAFRAATGWTPRFPLEMGLRLSIDYFRDHQRHYL